MQHREFKLKVKMKMKTGCLFSTPNIRFAEFPESIEKLFQVSCAVTVQFYTRSQPLLQAETNGPEFLSIAISAWLSPDCGFRSVSWGPNFISISSLRRCPPVWDAMIQLWDLLLFHNDKLYVNTSRERQWSVTPACMSQCLYFLHFQTQLCLHWLLTTLIIETS